jgi:PTH1 family peptidyl-tRNA hydrolase
MSSVRLIVGLGNPGQKYEPTRHNAGSSFVEEVARRADAALRVEPKFDGRLASARIGSGNVYLFIPGSYMNVSGLPVARVARFYKISVDQILVAHDELELPPGEVRFKAGGGHGGHNGLRDLVKHLGNNGFSRLRIGIGHPGASRDVADYVLKKPSVAEAKLIEEAMYTALNELSAAVDGKSRV